MEEKKLYFAHPINVYGTELQRSLLGALAEAFPSWTVENPDQPHHQAGYERYAREKGRGMLYYFEEVVPKMKGVAYLPFRDGMIGKGVYGEAERILEATGRCWEISPEGLIVPVDRLSPVRCLTVEATRERIRRPDGTTRPY